jgi:hypothetical protein
MKEKTKATAKKAAAPKKKEAAAPETAKVEAPAATPKKRFWSHLRAE